MKRFATALLTACLFACAALGQTAITGATKAAPIFDPAANADVIHLGGQLMLAGKAYEYDRVLADQIGPRLTGSSNYLKAAEWAESEFKRLGLKNAHREAWEMEALWEPETYATARIIAPHEQRMHMESDGWSPSTPPGGVRGRVYYLHSFKPDEIKSDAAQIKDAVVLIDRGTFAATEGFQFGNAIDGMDMMVNEGAQAFLYGMGYTNDVASMLGIGAGNGKIARAPVGNVGNEDTSLLRRLLERGPVEVEFSFKNKVREHAKVDNVVAEIPGTDANGEYVVIGGHLDSWHLGTGAEDNGTGAASVLAVAEAIEASGVKPKRTMRFILFGGEEQGLIGSIDYVKQHVGEMEKCEGVFITDTGSEPPEGWYTFGREDEVKALGDLKSELAELDATGTTEGGGMTFSTDQGAFLLHGVPAFVLWTPMEKYSQLHHKPADTFDKVDQRDLNLGAAVVGVTALAFADATTDLPHLSQADVESQLKKIKAFDEYQDMLTHGML
ncbi:MAG TPA: M20/M25/M40 family metallo-hydrolase [Terracidiphilus sp.]|nr:M20/M25/M40 family metallo-hydrolase [Terracidiphilus sp.]